MNIFFFTSNLHFILNCVLKSWIYYFAFFWCLASFVDDLCWMRIGYSFNVFLLILLHRFFDVLVSNVLLLLLVNGFSISSFSGFDSLYRSIFCRTPIVYERNMLKRMGVLYELRELLDNRMNCMRQMYLCTLDAVVASKNVSTIVEQTDKKNIERNQRNCTIASS